MRVTFTKLAWGGAATTIARPWVFLGVTPGPNSRMTPVDRENKLFVGMLPHDADDMTLTAVFSRFGEITEVRR